MLKAGSVAEYRQAQIESNWAPEKPDGLSERAMYYVRQHGYAVSLEIFDSVRVGVPFRPTWLVGELSTLCGYSPDTERCIIGAILRYLALVDPPQAKPIGEGRIHFYSL